MKRKHFFFIVLMIIKLDVLDFKDDPYEVINIKNKFENSNKIFALTNLGVGGVFESVYRILSVHIILYTI